MDLGCLDLGCISLPEEKQMMVNVSAEPRNSETSDSSSATAKFAKNKSPRGSPPSGVNAPNKFTSQIKKPPHRKTSPLNWFPRKKVDSYLKRKIKLLQEAGGMNDTLDETLGHSNPHYCRVEREKIVAREAACKVMEARKAAMVEASWCRILQAARIPTQEVDVLLLKAEKEVAEAFEAATVKGVIMYDTPDRPLKHFEIVRSSANGGKGSTTTHTVKASFQTAFEVDKQVAAAVKTTFIRLAHCSLFNKDEFKDLLRKISENPECQNLSESDNGSELEPEQQTNEGSCSSQRRQKKLSPEKFNGTKLVDMMFERLKCLKEEELASLATIVATCGLNAALTTNTESCNKVHNKISTNRIDYLAGGTLRPKQVEPELPSLDKFLVKKMTKLEKEVQEARNSQRAESNSNVDEKPASVDVVPDLGSVLVKHSSKLEKEIAEARRNQKILDAVNGSQLERKQRHGSRHLKQENSEVPSLDMFLVKHVSRLERAVQEAKNKRNDVVPVAEGGQSNASSSVLVKHSSKLEKEIAEAKRNQKILDAVNGSQLERKQRHGSRHLKQENSEVPSLDKFLVKHVSRLERAVQEAKNKRNDVFPVAEGGQSNASSSEEQTEKENVNSNGNVKGNDEQENRQDKILVKPLHRLEKEKLQALVQEKESGNWNYRKHQRKTNEAEGESLDKVLVRHVSRLEKERMGLGSSEMLEVMKKNTKPGLETSVGGLDQILVKHNKSRLEREKTSIASEQLEDGKTYSMTQHEARERELLEMWGGIGLGNSMQPHVSRLEREKAAWLKAEEEERRVAQLE